MEREAADPAAPAGAADAVAAEEPAAAAGSPEPAADATSADAPERATAVERDSDAISVESPERPRNVQALEEQPGASGRGGPTTAVEEIELDELTTSGRDQQAPLDELEDDLSGDDGMERLSRQAATRQSIFGFTRHQDLEESQGAGWRNKTIADIFIRPTDNKLAVRLFGSQAALTREIRRGRAANGSMPVHPASRLKIWWDMLMIITLLTIIFVLPLEIAFLSRYNGADLITYNIFCDIVFMADIVFIFFVGYIDTTTGKVTMKRSAALSTYIGMCPCHCIHILQFAADIVGSVPIDTIMIIVQRSYKTPKQALAFLQVTKAIKFVKLFRAIRLVGNIKRWEQRYEKATLIIKIVNMSVITMLIVHWNGCIQFYAAYLRGWKNDSWITIERLQKASIGDRYWASIFRSMSHLIGLGYGVNSPASISDMQFILFSMLIGATCYALVVAYFTDTIQSFDVSSKQFRDHLQRVNEYMSFRKLPHDLRDRVTKYYECRYGRRMFDESLILAEVSESLRMEIKTLNCKQVTDTVPLFNQGNETVEEKKNFQNDMINALQFEMYMPGDTILDIKIEADRMFFIQKGSVLLEDANGVESTRLADGSYFGEIGLLNNSKPYATVKALNFCSLYSLSKAQFHKIMEKYPQKKKYLQSIAGQRMESFRKDRERSSSQTRRRDRSEERRRPRLHFLTGEMHPTRQPDSSNPSLNIDEAL